MGGGGMRTDRTPSKTTITNKIARLGHFPPASQAGHLACLVFYVYVNSLELPIHMIVEDALQAKRRRFWPVSIFSPLWLRKMGGGGDRRANKDDSLGLFKKFPLAQSSFGTSFASFRFESWPGKYSSNSEG
jgi:hypothetical protein